MKKLFVCLFCLITTVLLPVVAQAQYIYTTSNGTITITGYIGSGGDVTIPDTINVNGNDLPVTSIGHDAFQYCSSLTSVTIGNGVTSIGDLAFADCSSLNSVTIGNGVTSIGYEAFAVCTSLTVITVDASNFSYNSVDGVLFNKNQTTLIQCPGHKAGSYSIPDSVTSIGNSAFSWCTNLTSVTIPNSVTSIGDRAFQSCPSLTSVTIGNSVTNIGSYAFSSCYSLTSVTIGNSVTSIGDWAFYGCYSLTNISIPNSVTGFWEGACFGCSKLTSVTIGNGVTDIGWETFSYCTSLTNVTIGNSVTNIGAQAFQGCTSLTNISIPNSVTSIGAQAFQGCTSLTGVCFQGNAPIVGWSAFYGDNNATVYYLQGTTGWGPTFGGRPTALWLSTITTTIGAPPNTPGDTLKPVNPTMKPPSGNLKRWNGISWQSVTNWNDPNINTNQPTVVLVHGWYGQIDGTKNAPTQMSSLADAFQQKDENANILAWDWRDEALSLPGSPDMPRMTEIQNIGLKGAAESARRGGERQGKLLANELEGLHISNNNLQLIGHSNGGAVVGAACSELALGGQKVKRITTLDTPNLSLGELPAAVVWTFQLGIDEKLLSTGVNAMKYVKADSASQVEVYYSGLEAGRNAFGFGEPLLASSGNNRFNGMIYPGNVTNPVDPSQWDHLRIIDWYCGKDRTPQSPGPGQFVAGIDWSILSTNAGSFKAGTYAEQSFNSGVFGQFVPAQLQPVTLKRLWWDGFDTGSDAMRNWLGRYAETFMRDVGNFAARIVSGSDGYLWQEMSVPQDASYLTFDLKVETPGAGDFLTVSLGNEVICYKSLNVADSDFYTVDPIFVGDFAGKTETLLFTLNHVGDVSSSILLDNITFSTVSSAVQTSITGVGVWTNQFGFTITGISNSVIVVEACTNLVNPIWSPMQTNTLTGGSSYFSDLQWTNYPVHFYRLRSP